MFMVGIGAIKQQKGMRVTNTSSHHRQHNKAVYMTSYHYLHGISKSSTVIPVWQLIMGHMNSLCTENAENNLS